MPKSRLQLKVSRVEDWKQLLDSGDHEGVLFFPAAMPPAIGSDVRLEVTFRAGPLFLLDGRVVWRRPKSDRGIHAGAGIEVEARHRGTLSYISGWAAGTLTDRRRFSRLPLRIRVTYKAGGRRRINFTSNLSRDSVYVNSSQLAEVDAEINLSLSPPEHPTMALSGRVARFGASGEPRGMGIELIFPDAAAAARFASFVGELEKRLHRGELPPELLA